MVRCSQEGFVRCMNKCSTYPPPSTVSSTLLMLKPPTAAITYTRRGLNFGLYSRVGALLGELPEATPTSDQSFQVRRIISLREIDIVI